MSPNKIGFIITTDADKWQGEEGVGRYFHKRFSKIGNNFEYEIVHGVTGVLPKISEFQNYLGFIISGSGYSVNDPYQWIMNLQNFIIQLYQYNKDNKNKPAVRLFGICYGHQLIAKTFGGIVQPIKDNKFIYGAEKIVFNSKISSQTWFQETLNNQTEIMICQAHGEEVSQVPKNATIIASSETCGTEAFVYGQNIFSTQGHPEFELEAMDKTVGCGLVKNEKISPQQLIEGKQRVELVPYDLLTGLVLDFLKH